MYYDMHLKWFGSLTFNSSGVWTLKWYEGTLASIQIEPEADYVYV